MKVLMVRSAFTSDKPTFHLPGDLGPLCGRGRRHPERDRGYFIKVTDVHAEKFGTCCQACVFAAYLARGEVASAGAPSTDTVAP